MKLINIEQKQDGAVTLQFSREEFHIFRDALTSVDESGAMEIADYQRAIAEQEGVPFDSVPEIDEQGLSEESLEDLKYGLHEVSKFQAQVKALREPLEDIVSEHDLARYL